MRTIVVEQLSCAVRVGILVNVGIVGVRTCPCIAEGIVRTRWPEGTVRICVSREAANKGTFLQAHGKTHLYACCGRRRCRKKRVLLCAGCRVVAQFGNLGVWLKFDVCQKKSL